MKNITSTEINVVTNEATARDALTVLRNFSTKYVWIWFCTQSKPDSISLKSCGLSSHISSA